MNHHAAAHRSHPGAPAGDALADALGDVRTLSARLAEAERERDEARAQLDALSAWTRTYGAALCPTTGRADTFGDGMCEAKRQIAALLRLAGKDGAK